MGVGRLIIRDLADSRGFATVYIELEIPLACGELVGRVEPVVDKVRR